MHAPVTVAAVVVTYNRLGLLKICIDRLRNQSYPLAQIIIVNNGSTDGTTEYLAQQADLTIIQSENLGPAGGFNLGLQAFTQTGHHYAWVMDDDFIPHRDCLRDLLPFASPAQVLYPTVRDKNFNTIKYPGWSGILIHRDIIHRVGLPKKELFFWAEDTEYIQHRIIEKNKFRCLHIDGAKAVHFTTTANKRRAAWHYYYEIRNTIYFRLYIQDEPALSRYYKLARSISKLFMAIILLEKKKLHKLRHFSKGLVHGFNKKMGKTVSP